MKRRRLLALGFLLLAFACRSHRPAADGESRPVSASRNSTSPIQEYEIASANVTTALEAIRRLRPAMLSTRGTVTMSRAVNTDFVVYVDEVRMGGTNALSLITATTVREILYLSAADATTRFGTGHPRGAILVATKR